MAYVSSKQARDQIKMEVLELVAPRSTSAPCGRESYRLRGACVHVRYCAPGKSNYKFNINPNSLRASYDLWICGDGKHWYLIPVHVLRQMYDHPAAYPDNHHPEIRVVSVNALTHRVGYAAPSITLDLSPYFRADLAV